MRGVCAARGWPPESEPMAWKEVRHAGRDKDTSGLKAMQTQ
jgi:hypothetical protein